MVEHYRPVCVMHRCSSSVLLFFSLSLFLFFISLSLFLSTHSIYSLRKRYNLVNCGRCNPSAGALDVTQRRVTRVHSTVSFTWCGEFEESALIVCSRSNASHCDEQTCDLLSWITCINETRVHVCVALTPRPLGRSVSTCCYAHWVPVATQNYKIQKNNDLALFMPLFLNKIPLI